MKTILIVDDEPRTREGIRKTLESWSSGQHTIHILSSAVEALAWLQVNHAHLVITDIRMPEISGLDLIEQIHSSPSPPVVIVISGHAEFDYAQRALKYGVVEYLLKPIDKKKLVAAAELALKRYEDRNQVEQMKKLVDPKLMETAQEDRMYSTSIREAMDYLDQHLNEPVSLRDLSRVLHMNTSYLSSLFKEQTGLTFSDYMTRKRLQRAKELLVNTRLSINEISELVGYQTPKYFVKVFRTAENVSPGRYRANLQTSSEEKIQ
ncbi:response regulator [Paenibacillus sp. FSL W8-0426]|uniref:response regulator transcription factor n=1 Tax=Paenibacillus sp. FSL W8-0426 TaxID=2921714 RepID=UPI0030D94139